MPGIESHAVEPTKDELKGLHGTAYQALPILSAVAPFKAGGRGGPDNYTDIPAGALRARHANDLYIHPNSLVAVQVSGNEVAAWLERSASMFHQILPGAQDVPLIDDQFPSFNFDVIHGLSYRIDLSQPPPERLKSAGRPVMGVELEIVDDDRRRLPRGEVGEIAIRTDVTDEASVQAAVRAAVQTFGALHVLHNNVGATDINKDLDVVNLDVAAWDMAMAVNVRGAMLMSRHVIPHMIANGGGSIVHSASGFGVQGESTLTAYGSSKAALIHLNRMIATQYGKQNVRSNCMVIGFVLTLLLPADVRRREDDVPEPAAV